MIWKVMVVGVVWFGVSVSALAEDAGGGDAARLRRLMGPFTKALEAKAIPEGPQAEAVALGRVLFYDGRISGEAEVSCNSCHDLSRHGTGGAVAVKRREEGALKRDVPSIYNKATLELFDWDGRFKTITEKTKDALLGADELNAGTPDRVIERVRAIAGYAAMFENAFPDAKPAVSFDNLIAALVAFQEGLVTPGPIDAFILGDDAALTADQIKGGFLFDENNCSSCHTGTMFGGQMMQKVGVTMPWPNQKDLGHYYVSKNAAHKLVFRVPSLRNVADTAPYFHDASSRRLWDAIRKMGRHETGKQIGVEDVLVMQSYLKALSGTPDAAYVKKPALPE